MFVIGNYSENDSMHTNFLCVNLNFETLISVRFLSSCGPKFHSSFSEICMVQFEWIIRVFMCKPSIFLLILIASHTSFPCFVTPCARSPRAY